MSRVSFTSAPPARQVETARERIRNLLPQILHYYQNGSSGLSIARFMSDEVRKIIVKLIELTIDDQPPQIRDALTSSTAIVAIGGTGRGELAPSSDIDLLFLYSPRVENQFKEVASEIVRRIWDSGLKLGHNLCTVNDAMKMARSEPTFATSLIEMQRLWGAEQLVSDFQKQFSRQIVRRRLRDFLSDCLRARREDFGPHGATVTQLVPDVKRSPGGLRDLHLIRWIGFACFETTDWNSFPRSSGISLEDRETLNGAHEFLTRLRIDLHLMNEKSQDVLTREEQLRIAREWNIQPESGLKPVESLMQTYFRHTTGVDEICRKLSDAHRKPSWWKRMLNASWSHHVNGRLRIGMHEIDVSPRHKSHILGSIDELLRLYHTIGLYGIKPSRALQADVKQAVANLTAHGQAVISPESARLIVSIFSLRSALGMVLRSMYETGLLEFCFPEMTHARCLLQFNQYHHYTVDEHTFRAVEAVTDFMRHQGELGQAYRLIEEHAVLHLAVFLHDLGKGYPEDHSDVGKRIAEEVAHRLGLSTSRQEILSFLVHKHLLMTHLAFRRDIHDPETLYRFSQEVGGQNVLRMLYVLSAADLQAVGPGVWNGWKGELLHDLYHSSLRVLSGDEDRTSQSHRISDVKDRVLNLCIRDQFRIPEVSSTDSSDIATENWVKHRLDSFTPQYLLSTDVQKIVTDLQVLSELSSSGVDVATENDAETDVTEYRVITHENAVPGCFHKIAGALTANHLEILSAQITTTRDGFIVDRFVVHDHDYVGIPPVDRLRSVALSLRGTLLDQVKLTNLFQNQQRYQSQLVLPLLRDAPTRVAIDNSSSSSCTIIDVFAHDRLGLLYTLSRAIYELNLSVVLAKISTHLDQVVDVFYVTDIDHQKITDESRLKSIREALENTLVEFEQSGYRRFIRK